jgi:hypothetical protein
MMVPVHNGAIGELCETPRRGEDEAGEQQNLSDEGHGCAL